MADDKDMDWFHRTLEEKSSTDARAAYHHFCERRKGARPAGETPVAPDSLKDDLRTIFLTHMEAMRLGTEAMDEAKKQQEDAEKAEKEAAKHPEKAHQPQAGEPAPMSGHASGPGAAPMPPPPGGPYQSPPSQAPEEGTPRADRNAAEREAQAKKGDRDEELHRSIDSKEADTTAKAKIDREVDDKKDNLKKDADKKAEDDKKHAAHHKGK